MQILQQHAELAKMATAQTVIHKEIKNVETGMEGKSDSFGDVLLFYFFHNDYK